MSNNIEALRQKHANLLREANQKKGMDRARYAIQIGAVSFEIQYRQEQITRRRAA